MSLPSGWFDDEIFDGSAVPRSWFDDDLVVPLLTLTLYEGSTVIATRTQATTTDLLSYEFDLTQPEIDSVTDWTNVRLMATWGGGAEVQVDLLDLGYRETAVVVATSARVSALILEVLSADTSDGLTTAAASGSGASVAANRKDASSSARVSGSGASVAADRKDAQSSAQANGQGAAVSATRKDAQSAAAINGQGAALSATRKDGASSATVNGAGSAIAATRKDGSTSAQTSGQGGAVTATRKDASSTAKASGEGGAIASDAVEITRTASGSGEGAVTANATKHALSSAVVRGEGGTSASAQKAAASSAQLSGEGNAQAADSVVTDTIASTQTGALTLTGYAPVIVVGGATGTSTTIQGTRFVPVMQPHGVDVRLTAGRGVLEWVGRAPSVRVVRVAPLPASVVAVVAPDGAPVAIAAAVAVVADTVTALHEAPLVSPPTPAPLSAPRPPSFASFPPSLKIRRVSAVRVDAASAAPIEAPAITASEPLEPLPRTHARTPRGARLTLTAYAPRVQIVAPAWDDDADVMALMDALALLPT